MLIKVNVTPDDINGFETRASFSLRMKTCPIAFALQRVTNKAVTVGYTTCTINNKDYDLPIGAKHFIREFDNGALVSPISFEMEI